MRPALILLLVLTTAVACKKDVSISNSTAPIAHPAIEHGYSMEEVVGTYHGPYACSSNTPFPPPGSSFSFSDTVIDVVQDTVPGGSASEIWAKYQPFGVNADGTLTPYFSSDQFTGRFTWMGDTLHLKWSSIWVGDFGDVQSSSFNGVKH